MGIMNRRNAFMGWAVWEVGKRVAKKKAKGAIVPSIDTDTKRPNAGAVLSLAAVTGLGVWLWRKISGGGGDDFGSGE